jgi:hypothetical protein
MNKYDDHDLLCAHYGAPIGTACPESYSFDQDLLYNGGIHNSGPTLTELGYTKFEIIRNSAAAIFIGFTAAALVIALAR